MSGKYEKSRFVGVRRTKISENQLSSTGENQKSAKISFPPRGKIRNQRKTAFPRGGKSEISKNRLSPARENKKSAKNGFPPRGKIRNQQKSAFLHGGKSEISKNRLSPARENQKKRRWLHFLLLRKTKNPGSLTKQLSEAVHILHTLFRYLST